MVHGDDIVVEFGGDDELMMPVGENRVVEQ